MSFSFILINMGSMKIVLISMVLTLTLGLKMRPLLLLTDSNFHEQTGANLELFLQQGSPDHAPWFILFKIKGCQHCQQAELFFNSYYLDYHKRLTFEPEIATLLETNMHAALVDCETSPNICSQFNIEQYPTYLLVEGDGQVCVYQGGRSHLDIMSFMEDRHRGDLSKCQSIGRITAWTKVLGYLQPLQWLIDNNFVMFVIAFVIGPFLFGFLFSRNKKSQQPTVEKQD